MFNLNLIIVYTNTLAVSFEYRFRVSWCFPLWATATRSNELNHDVILPVAHTFSISAQIGRSIGESVYISYQTELLSTLQKTQ